ncbi:MAG: tetratricopeptide repeat protein [Candidatus Zixiibacteriota bacterium]|nr:MAG: tetratricopeptide repeat protein [candidate division Zixibacteria bacterium]
MYKKVILILFVVLAICSAIYALFDRRPVTTSSDEAYRAYEKGVDYANKLYSKEALQEFERAVKLDPQFAMAHLRASSYYWEFGQNDKYEESREKALALLDKVKDIERLHILLGFAKMDRKTKEIEKYSTELLDRYPDNFDAIDYLAGKYFNEGNYEKAAEVSLRSIKINPEYAPAYNILGYIYYYLGEYEKSLEYLKRYAEIGEGQANPHDSRGEILMNLGYYDEALQEFLIADSIKPNLQFVLGHIGDVYSGKWMLRDAIGAYMKAAELASSEKMRVEQNLKIASCYYYMDRAYEAVAVLEEIALKSSDNVYLHSELGGFYTLTGDMDKALIQLGIVKGLIAREWASENYPDSLKEKTPPVQLFLEARIASERGNYQEAIDLLEQVLEQLKPHNSAHTLRTLAENCIRAEMPDSAIVVLNEVLKRNPNSALCLLRLSEAYQSKGMKKEQKETLERFLAVVRDGDQNIRYIREAFATLAQLEKEPS